jgi:integrase
MASIFKRTGSPCWFCRYRATDGTWQKKTTKLENRGKALQWCLALQAAQDTISRGSASEAQLRSIIEETMRRVTGQDIAMSTVREWFSQWLDAKAGANADLTLIKYRQAADDFLTSLGAKADGRLDSVSQRDVITFRDGMRGDGKSATTINQLIAKIVATPFRAAFKQGLIRMDPTAGIPKLKDKGSRRKQAFTPDQVRTLLASATDDWKGAILAGYTTGMRLGDVSNLQEEQIDYDNDVISFYQGKTQSSDDDATVIGLHPDFRQWLETRKVRSLTGPVFPSLAGQSSSGRSGLSMAFARIMKNAGIESVAIREKEKDSKGRSVHALTFHSFRHSAATNIFKAKIIEEAQKRVTGHARGRTLKTYTHVDLEAVKAASLMIPKLGLT